MSTFLSRHFPRDLSASSFLSLDLSAAREKTLDIDVKHARLGEFHGRQCETLPEGIGWFDGRLRGDGSGFHVEVAGPRTHAAGIRYRFPSHHSVGFSFSFSPLGIYANVPRARRAAAANPTGSVRIQLSCHLADHPYLGLPTKCRIAPLRRELGGASADPAVGVGAGHRQRYQ